MLAEEIEKSFALLILSLGLTAEGSKTRSLLSKSYPFSFYATEAVAVMQDMSISICNKSTKTTISFRAQTEAAARKLLLRFVRSRLLHCPSDRTREEIKPSMLLQPTAKGVHFVERYCQKQSINTDRVEGLISSVYNSMRCISLDRRSSTDEIEESETFICLVFQRLLGPFPNVYSPENEFEEIVVDRRPDSGTFSMHSSSSNITLEKQPKNSNLLRSRKSLDSASEVKGQISPYAHRYFTHPDSASVTQYYLSTHGMRLFQHPTKGFYFSGKACWQWLMECTDALYSREALALGTSFIKHGFIEPTIALDDDHLVRERDDHLINEREALYTLTSKGKRVCLWYEEEYPEVESLQSAGSSGSDSEDLLDGVTLKSILSDAGLRLLFRDYLSSNYCEENFLFYCELEKFNSGCASLSGSMEEKQVRELVSAACTIYNRFIAPNSPYEINICFELRERLCVLLDGRRPIDGGLLSAVEPLFNEACHQVYKMMKQDSLSKFLRSHEFRSKLSHIAPAINTSFTSL
ncbi:hypothetical protein TRVA0_033S01684 [Trichomonascus vanleenenianus]|uniref:GTPase-activating protein SST2 n=1 Tax=Trichomonascus vanleenenianus TaxID=2268995 RepID=UPI003ECB70AD